jgi:PBP1b-binding outer membrane lipoprotein LpoB
MQTFIVTTESRITLRSDENPKLPTLSSEQSIALEAIPDLLTQAESLINMLGSLHLGKIDPEVGKMIDESDTEDKVRNLTWTIIDKCENYGSPLFNRLHTGHLLDFLYLNQTMSSMMR